MSTPVSIVIPAFNQLDYCRQCLTSLLANTPPPYRLVLVDNGSTDGVGEYFDSIPGAVVVHTGENLGFAGGINRGLTHCEGHALLLNSDTILTRGWLDRLVRALEQSDDIGMVGPRSNCVSGYQEIPNLHFAHEREVAEFADQLHAREGDRVTDTGRLVGFCLLVRDRVLRDVGGFDERYGIGNFEDDDYGLRVLRAGYRLCVAEGAFVFHYGSRTFAGMGLVEGAWRDLIERNKGVFAEKWGITALLGSDEAQASMALNRSARAAAERGDMLAALRDFEQAIAACPALAENYNDLGAVLWEAGEHRRARDLFARALALDPEHPAAADNLRDADAVLNAGEGTSHG
jgi:glycosyltransferase involved in cell wall biosynthesis